MERPRLSETIWGFLFITVVHCQLTCNFEVDTCQWHLSNGWMRSQGKASNLDTGPADDRTNPDGFYLHLNLSHFQPDEKAFVLSPPILDVKKKYCLSFFYLMHGKQVATLSVHVLNTSSSTEVWATSFEHGPEWLHQEVLIENGHQVIFEGVFGGGLGDIAIDDIEMNEGECLVKAGNEPPSPLVSLPFNCTFEGGSMCGYTNDAFNMENWKFGSGSTSTSGTGPDNDNTFRTQKGHYLHVDLIGNFFYGVKVSLLSPTYKTSKDACVQFWYNMYGPGVYKLFVAINKRAQWSMQGSQGYGWKSAFLHVSGPMQFQLTFYVTSGRAKKGDIAIDDISIQEGKCPQSVDCSFENTLCAWSNTGDDDFDWSPRTGKHSSKSLGPSADHTLGSDNGTYMIIDSKPPRRRSDRARLVSTTITETVKTHCLKFWYSMNGKNVGELRVFIYTQSASSLEWRLIGPQGGHWAFASVPIKPRRDNFWLVIEGVVGSPSQSYIAFDDISLTEGTCKTAPSKAATGLKTQTSALPVKSTTPLITVNPSKMILSCDFTKDFCGWQQGKHDKADWIRTKKATPSLLTGPQRDHTTGKGSYIFVKASNGTVGAVRLFSGTITPIHEDMCLKFWYFMYGQDIDKLRVFISPGTHFNRDMNPHWLKSGSQPKKWLLGNIFFQMKQTFQIVFEATLNGGIAGDIALDDILLTYGPCNAGEEITTSKPGITEKPIPIEQRNCDFESKDICGYMHVKGSPNYYWRRISGETDSWGTGPSADHTTNSAEGHYMYIEGSRKKMGTVARMITPLYQDATSTCLQFYYHMYGSGIGNFSIYILPRGSNNRQLIYFTSGNHGRDWEVDRVTIDKLTAAAGYQIMFEATIGKNSRSDIALDDISFSAGKCASLGDCNFEDDSCTWKNVKTDDFDWVLRSGKTPTPLTGPEFDHTLQNDKGHYMYIETSPPIKPGMKAQLVSTLLPRIGNYMCLEFWYSMNGKTVDSLKVILQVTGYSKTVLWHLKGDQGKNWLYAQVPLKGTATTYTIFFEATSGAKYTGDIAIDDISFTENRCQIRPANAQVTTTAAPHITTPAPSTPAPVSRNFSCNFDKNLCGWKQDERDSNQWHWKRGPTSTDDTGPPGDHTSGNGHYIYLETSFERSGSKARLISPDYIPDNTGINCVSFWYYMYGADVDALNVYIQYGLMRSSLPIWSAKGNKGQTWIHGKFSFNSSSVLNVVLEAVVGLSYEGDIAVDDVSISSGKCVDYNNDLFPTCDFETKSLCGFSQSTSDDYDWVWHSGRTPSSGTGPNADHTLGTRAGHYVYIDGSKPYGSSVLTSPTIHTMSTSCVQFYYHMQGSVGELFIYQKIGNRLKRLWHRSGHQSISWQLASIEVDTQASSYKVRFEGKDGGRKNGDIAIDDFSVLKGKCQTEGRCDFENGTCIWQNSRDDDFDWIVKKAEDSSKSTAPTKDHTINKPGSGHFLYVSTDHNPPHTKALIETTDFEPGSKTCFHFWFNGYGNDPGTFTVSIKSRGHSHAIWQLAGTKVGRWPKNGKWQEARVQIPRRTRTFTISIDVVVGKSGYVAIDDVIIDNEKDCSRVPAVSLPVITEPSTTMPTTLPHFTTPTTPKKRVPSVSCHFTDDLCGWTQDKTDDVDWIRINRASPSRETGPSADHTSGTGYYIYIETSPTKAGDVARLISPKVTLKNRQTKCLTFWYNMYGRTIGTLSLLLLVNGKMGAPIWKRQKSQGEKWMRGKVNLKGFQSSQVVFEANSGSGYFGDIALDDIELHGSYCRSVDASPLPSCDFESTCNYKLISRKPFIPWIITSSSNHPNIADHTYNTLSGEFIYVNLTGVSPRQLARMETPVLKSGRYCLEFFYRSTNHFNGNFTVHTSSNGATKNLLTKNGLLIKSQWTIAEANIKESTHFTVMFETISRQRSQGTLAVDDIVFKNGDCPSPGSCDFERGHLCFWTNDPANNIDWTVNNGKTLTPSTGPLTDHTKETQAGIYALLEVTHPAKVGDWEGLVSQPLNNNNVKSCFKFWYSMNGRQVATLSVSVKFANNVQTRYWLLSGNQGKNWYHGQVPLPAAKEDFQIVIEGRVGGIYGDIAVDDLFVSENGCGLSPRKAQVYIPTTTPPLVITTTNPPIISGDNTFNCTFEKGTCGWVQSSTDDLDWTRNRGYTPSKETGPQGDHTTGRGYYMYLEATGNRRLKKAELTFIANNEIPGMKCMQFWYSMRGSSVGSLNIYIITEVNKQLPVWTKSGTQGPTWNLGKVEFNGTATFKVLIEGVKDHHFLGDIAIDDITLQNGLCKEPYGDCDFETLKICGYHNDFKADFSWIRTKGKTSSHDTGPTADHTYGTDSGHYMYIESSSPRKQNDTARLISPVYKATPDEHCLQFYYNMYGADVGALNVKIRIHNSDNTTYDTDNYLQIVGERGANWKLAQMGLPKLVTENPYQLLFEGVIGKGFYGDIAIDDIIINTEQCEIEGDCDFDYGRCTWVNTHQGDDFDWMIESGATSTPETGPLTDHTLQKATGCYLFIDASFPRVPGQKAWYVSQYFPPTFGQSRCITFWYSMNGLGVGILRVVIAFETGGNNTLWELNRDQGNDWQFGQAPIKSPTPYKIIFEAVRGPNEKGDIAIDDILFTEFTCSVLPFVATPKGGMQTLPKLKGTTPSIRVVEGVNCTFDLGVCGWTQDTTDKFDWRENKGETPESGTGPRHDHSSGGHGFYFYIDTKHHSKDDAARLISPLMRPNGLQCFTVWYHMYGSDIGSFNVYIFTGPSLPKPEFHRYGRIPSVKICLFLLLATYFNGRRVFDLKSCDKKQKEDEKNTSQIILEATAGWGWKGNIAVDDVSLVDGHCVAESVGEKLLCTFEDRNMCGYTQDKDDVFHWKSSSYLTRSSLPDHTYGTRSGHFMYALSSVSREPDQYASLSSPVYSVNSTDLCIEFWYHMNGVGVGTLTVSSLSNKDNFKTPTPLWSREGPQGNRWLQGLIDIDLTKDKISHIRIKFYGIIGPAYWNLIALDDIKISSDVCKRNRGDCNFEKNVCNWVNIHNDDFEWTIGSGFTTTTKTGPLKDHTRAMQGGSYLYIQPESTFVYDDNANSRKFTVLESETFDQSQLQCFQFYYYMKGAKDGGLEVLLHPEGSSTMTPLWQLEGHQSGNWTLAQIHLPAEATTYQVIIKGFRGPRFEGQIAIDDLSFSKTFPCKTLPLKAAISPTTTTPLTTTPVPIVGFDCTFDRNVCGWRHDTHSKFQWSRQKGSNSRPVSDHTGGGFFIYLDSSNMNFNKHATLFSPGFPITTQRCLSFFYYMSGEDLNTLSVGLRTKQGLEVLWKRSGPQGDQWIHATVNLPVFPGKGKGSIEVKGVGPSVGASGFMALDDISLYPGQCQEPKNRSEIDCDFENPHICGYTQDQDDHFDWSYGSGMTKLKENQPNADHTYGTGFGHYMYLNSSKRSVGEKAVLWTPYFQKKGGSCLTFWYRMSGPYIGSLEIHFAAMKGHRHMGPLVWIRRGDQKDNWIQEYVPIEHMNSLYVLFQGVAGVRPGGIAIDDVKLLPSCIEPGDCTFEIDTCGWRNAHDNDIDWQHLSLGHHPFYGRVPSIDHTTNGASGHIMLFTSRHFTNRGKKGDLLSVSFDPTSEKGLCLEFWFIVDGYKFGNLTVFKQTNSTERIIMWHLPVSKITSWTRGSFHVKSSEPYQIGFRAVKGGGSNGYIAIDDINYSGVFCAVTPRKAEPHFTSTVPPSTTQPTTARRSTIPPSPYDCTFEGGFCKWTQATDDDFDWMIGTGYTETDNTGPVNDHTLGTSAGHFTFIETSFPRKRNDRARLVSPVMKTVGSTCLSFWYHMYGENVDTLNIYISHNKKRKTAAWSRVGTLNRKWYAGRLNFYSLSSTQIIFEAIRGVSYRGDIALDDIRITKGFCPDSVKYCDFENADLCNYKQSGSDDFDWSVGNASVSPNLPRKDHTDRTNAGHFLYVFGNHSAKSKAQILGPVMPHTSGYCVRFWYSLNGPITLNVYSLAGGQSKMLANYMSKKRIDWLSGYVDIKSLSTWEVMFEANVTANSPSSYIAIDDVRLTRGICGLRGDCTFEMNTCGWRNQGYDDFDWIIKRAGSGGSGPRIDHTLQNDQGSYFFIDGSSPQKAGDKASLRHTYLSMDRQRLCLRFWYSMHGGMLEISLVNGPMLWRVYGEHGPNLPYEWKYARVPLPVLRIFGTIIITGNIGSGADSYIAIDDISFQSSKCTRFPVESDPAHVRPPTTQTPVIVTPSFVPNSTYDCAFEHGFCSWSQSKSDVFNWTRWHGATRTIWTGPDKDHTTGTALGWYIYIESSRPRKEGDTAVLVSRPFKSNTEYCFMFYYYMYGTVLGKLNVILTNKAGSNLTLWTKSRSHGKKWIKEAFRIPNQNNQFTLSFEGIVGSSVFGDIAIDDVRAAEGECTETGPLNCTFESAHLCGYTTPANHDVKWKKRSENKNSRLGPSHDHTVNTFDGTYMYLEWDTKDQRIAQAQLISPPIKTSSDFCMSFYYQMFHRTQGELSVYQQVGNTIDTPLWVQTSNREHGWIKGQVTLPAHENYKVVFEGKIKNYDGSIQIDDISTELGSCPEPGNCDFEQDQCTWTNMKDDQIDWIYGRGDTPTPNTGPSTDHTTYSVSGHYMFIEASFVPKGRKAKLRSMTFPPTSARCMHFWYHMYGKQMGGLKVYFADEKSGNNTAIWYLKGDQGNKWQYAQVAFAWVDVNYVIIEGIRGSGYLSDIAIDDIVFTQDYCATMPTNAQTDYVLPKAVTTTPPPTWSPTTLDCNFENKCSWRQSKDDDFDWEIHHGKTPSQATGPPFDHTLGTAKGHYIYIETSLPRRTNDKARFESSLFVPTQKGCLRFWYFMYGPDVDTLTVYQKDGGTLTPIWIKTGNIDAVWHEGLVPVRSDKQIQIVFEGRRGSRWLGDIALDDIAFSFKGCPSSADMICGFEKPDICGFKQSKKEDFNWKWFRPGNSHITRQNDHTLGTAEGHYMLVSGSDHKPGENALIISPTYSSKTSKCVEFWYYMSGENSGSLNVYATTNQTRLKLWSRSGNQGNVWSLAQVTVRNSGTFNLEIEAVIDKQSGNIAIDDFSMFHGDCPKPGNCDFEKGWCTWNNNRTDDFDWQIGTGYLGMSGAPRRDHTTNSGKGHFIFLRAGFPIQAGARAVLISEMFEGTFHKCMSFWYFMKEAGTAILNVYIVTSESKTLSWTLSGNQQQERWSYARLPILHKQQAFKIIIEGIKGAGNRVNIALDDVSFTDRICQLYPDFATTLPPTLTPTGIRTTTTQLIKTTPVPTKFDCTFEKGMCRWKQDTTDNFDWIRSQGPMGSNFTGLLKDHTLGTDDGWYVYTDSSPTAKPLDEARLIGPPMKASKNRCLNFWYHMYGAYIDALFVYLSTNGANQTIWEQRGDQGDAWVEAFLNLPALPSTTYQVIFGSRRTAHVNQPIALDDIRFTENKCHENNPSFCDFEDATLCNYTQLKTDDFDWTWGSGRTPTFLTGPIRDHTTGTKHGHYMYIESSQKKPYKKAQFGSPGYNSTDTKCLHFYYYMYGDHVYELNVYRVDGVHFGEVGTPIWSRKYNLGPIWVEGQTSIFPGSNYHIIFEGITGKGALSDIAIDDISLTSGPCQLRDKPRICKSNDNILVVNTRGISPCPARFCDFEKDLCTWKNIKSDQFDWIRGRGFTDTPDTGPSSDHTSGTPEGYYVYIETSDPQTPGDVARLQSEDFLPTNLSLCLRFWYQMNGEDVDSLNVLVQNTNEKGEGYVWSQKGDNGHKWLYAQLNINWIYTNKPYHLLFEGIRGKDHNGDIAIDDVDASIGECAIVPPYADPKQRALATVKCNFDDGKFCELQQSKKDDFDWQIRKGQSLTFHSGPKADHSGSGYYIYFKNHRMVKGYKAVLSSPTLGPTTGEGNCFTFYYHMYGMQIGTLNIYTVRNGNKTLRWTKSGEQGSNWKYAHFNINSKFNYQIYIEGVSSGGYYEVIALDDFAMDANPCPPARECDFSLNLCGWTSQEKYKQWLHAVTPTPIADHSTGTNTGGFLYTNATAAKKTITVSRVLTPSYPPASGSCLKFWYYMNGRDPGELNLQVELPYTGKRIWQRKEAQGDLWWLAHVDVGRPTLHLTQPYKFIFDSVQNSGPSTNGIIAIDDVEHLPGPCSNNGVCDFEQDLCGFNNIKGDNFDWIRGSGKTGSIAVDHTFKSPKGHYLYIKAGRFNDNNKGWLASWVQEKTAGKCLKFWYNMHGKGIGKLNVLMWTAKSRKTVWSESGNNGRDWLSASITLISQDPFTVVFEGVKGPAYASAVAIDDLSFLGGSCETQTTPSLSVITQPPTPASLLMCDFERSLCGWKQDTTENADWIMTTGASHTGGPPMDHTNDNYKGGYVMVKSSSLIANRTARLMSDVIYQDQPVCLTFWYHMHGGNPGTLNVYVKNMGEKKDAVWTKFGDQGMAWRYAEIEIAKPEKRNKIYFEGIRNLGYGDISLDDINLLLDNCPPRDFCDFEEPDICGYEQGDTDVFDWTWGSGHRLLFGTGPKNDHTYKTKYGHYMYIEVLVKSRGDNAHLYSPVYPATTQERCLNFWYSMNGRNVARLNVYLYQNNQFGDQIWSLQMNQGPHWHLATVPVKSEISFQMVFEGIRGKGRMGDIAIDDVKLSKEACDPVAFCTFEESICGWENLHDIHGADFDWQRIKASSVQSGGGPSVDHTIGKISGFYMLINNGLRNGGVARLRSQTIPLLPNNPKSYCFQFWYNVYGTHMGKLNVTINYHGDVPETIWSEISGNNIGESKWRHGMVLIEEPYSHFEIVLEGSANSTTKNYIAVDDLQLLSGICPHMKESTFTCHAGKTISSSKVCDFLQDCPDSDDEKNCGDCTFEDGMCTWVDASVGALNWTRNQGRGNSNRTKINADHTKGTDKGWYIGANAYSGRLGFRAVLQNRALQQTSATCQLNFWYYISGQNMGSLSVVALEGGKITKLWKVSHDYGNRWIKATADIGKISRPFKLQFIGMGTIMNNGIYAVDDIELQDCNFPGPEDKCASTEFQCKRMGCVDKSRVCDLSDDCGDRSDEIGCRNFTSCDFETNLCNWSQDKSDNFDWSRLSEATNKYWSGPSRDHSKGTASGYYIYAERPLLHSKNEKARLISPLIEPPGNKECWIRFFYHARGFNRGSLNLYTRTSLLGPKNKVWSKHGHLGDGWERADVKLFSVTYFQAVFEAVIEDDYKNYVALDDITLTPGCRLADPHIRLPDGTKTKPTPSPCGAGLFQCKSSECILQSQVCDFNKHCKDGSDENICGTCDFELWSNCGWKDRSTGRFKWQSHQGKSPAKFGPPRDHTSNSDVGKYMMVLGAYGVYRTHAILETQPLGATAPTCQVRFYVYMLGQGVGEISLNVINAVTHQVQKQVANVTGTQGEKWKRIVGNIGAQPAGFALQFNASPNLRQIVMKTDMAIDDVKLLNCGLEPESITSTPSVISKTVTSTPSVITKEVTAKSTPKGPTVCGNDSFSCPTATHLCFPASFRCDGHADCPDKYDEDHCETCPKGQTYCIPKHQCLSSHRCDGIVECPDGSDESACKECQDGFCLNGGTCTVERHWKMDNGKWTMENGSAKCQCKEKDVNFRCLPVKSLPQTSGNKKMLWISLGIFLSFTVFRIVVGTLFIFWNKRRRQYSLDRSSEQEGIQNPAYDYDTNLPAELNITDDLDPPAFSEPSWNVSSPNSIENPVYSGTDNGEL